MKKVFYVLVLVLALVACNKEDANKAQTKEVTEEKTESKEAANIYESKDLKVSKDKDGKAVLDGKLDSLKKLDKTKLSDGEVAIYAIISSKFDENFHVFFNSEKFQFDLKQRSGDYKLVSNSVKALSNGQKDGLEDWEAFKKEIMEISSLYSNFEQTRKPVIRLVNPYNANKIVFAFEDGKTIYDFAEFGTQKDEGKEGVDIKEELPKK